VSLRNLPIGMYGMVMGLAGLGLSARAAAPVLPGLVPAPAYFTELWVALGVIAFAILLPLYVAKIFTYPAEVKAEFSNPVTLGFCGALPVGMALVAGGVAPYLPMAGGVLWWTSLALLTGLQVWALHRLLSGGMDLAQLNAGWMIVLVGGIVLPGPGIALGEAQAARFAFGVSAAAAPLLMALLLYRAAFAAPLPEVLRPSWFILLVAPTLIYANGIGLYGSMPFLENLYFFSLVLAAALLVYARNLLQWRFGAPWWAFTFPLDALAYAAARYAQDHPSPLAQGATAAALLAATLAVVIVLWRTLRSAASPRA
jgi:tellurite resistance protein